MKCLETIRSKSAPASATAWIRTGTVRLGDTPSSIAFSAMSASSAKNASLRLEALLHSDGTISCNIGPTNWPVQVKRSAYSFHVVGQ